MEKLPKISDEWRVNKNRGCLPKLASSVISIFKFKRQTNSGLQSDLISTDPDEELLDRYPDGFVPDLKNH
jgi:hypothetical protein